MADITVKSDNAQVTGTFRRLQIGRPAATDDGPRRGKRVLRLDVELTGCDEDIDASSRRYRRR